MCLRLWEPPERKRENKGNDILDGPDGVITCPRCDNHKHSFIKTRLIWFCKGCKKQFTVKVGTIFEDSALGLDKWMTAVWMLVNCKNGISSHELGRALHITQKSAWFMLQRIRGAIPAPIPPPAPIPRTVYVAMPAEVRPGTHRGVLAALLVVVFALGVVVGRLTSGAARR